MENYKNHRTGFSQERRKRARENLRGLGHFWGHRKMCRKREGGGVWWGEGKMLIGWMRLEEGGIRHISLMDFFFISFFSNFTQT